jgi:hypothetical protein
MKIMRKLYEIFFSVFTLASLDSIFNNDASEIISAEGRRTLHDKEKMKKIYAEIEKQQKDNPHVEIII